jgi:sporulation protein YlmC with PRC-barrel domain
MSAGDAAIKFQNEYQHVPRNRRVAVAQTTRFTIGADATCTDGACGQLSRVIVNPVAREVTHIVVGPKHRRGPARFVPVSLVDATTGQIRLRCTLAEFRTLRPAEETELVPDLDPTGHAGYASERANRLSLYAQRANLANPSREVTVDSVPSGEVDVRRGLIVRAADGEIGQVQGVVVETGRHQVTHVLLKKGHIRGRKEVAIPIDAVTKIGTMLIHLSLTKHQVEALPPVDTDHAAG